MDAKSQKLPQSQVSLFGSAGGININDTDSHEGDWFLIEILEDAVFTTFQENGFDPDGATLDAVTVFSAGQRITNGLGITTVQLASGFIRCYNR